MEISYSLKTSEPATQHGMPEGKVPQNTWTICIAEVNHWSISMSNPLEERLSRGGFKILEIQQQDSNETFLASFHAFATDLFHCAT